MNNLHTNVQINKLLKFKSNVKYDTKDKAIPKNL